jgi:hypothetical protein
MITVGRVMVAQFARAGLVFVRRLHEGNPHSEVGIADAHVALGLEAHAVGFEFHMEDGSCWISGLGFHVAAVQADIAQSGPGPDVVSGLTHFGAVFTLEAGAATFFRALEAVAGVSNGNG